MYIAVFSAIIVSTGLLFWSLISRTKKTNALASSEELEEFVLLFRINQTLSLEIEEELRNYIDTRKTGNEFLSPGITLNMVLDRIEKDNLTILNDDVLEEYERLVPNKTQLRNSIEVLQLEYEGLVTLNQKIHHHKILNMYNGPFRKEQPR